MLTEVPVSCDWLPPPSTASPEGQSAWVAVSWPGTTSLCIVCDSVVSEWVAWHDGYRPGSPLARRLATVQGMIRTALDTSPPGPISLISLCAGDGRDVLGVLPGHPRCADLRGRLVELDPELAERARELAAAVASAIEVVTGDAALTSSFSGAVPAGIVLACGIFGNITDDDIRNTVAHLPMLCAPDAVVIWTRGTFSPDLTPTIRRWFIEAGFSELDFIAIPDTTAGVGVNRLTSPPHRFDPGARLFTFLPAAERPSRRIAG